MGCALQSIYVRKVQTQKSGPGIPGMICVRHGSKEVSKNKGGKVERGECTVRECEWIGAKRRQRKSAA
jgi:hypothetical protein